MVKANRQVITNYVQKFEAEACNLYDRQDNVKEIVDESIDNITKYLNNEITAKTLFEDTYILLYRCMGTKKYFNFLHSYVDDECAKQNQSCLDILKKYKLVR